MSRARHIAWTLVGIAIVIIGSMPPAHAAFSNGAAVAPMSITSIDVAAPTGVSTGGTKCTTTYDAWTATYTTTLNARLAWKASATPRGVSGYLVTAVFSDGGRYHVALVGPGTTSLSGDFDAYYATQNIRVVVTTLTSYGWTEESAPSGAIKC